MRMHVAPLCLTFLLLSAPISAQETLKRTFGQVFSKIFSEVDTTYIAENRYNLAFMLEQSFWGEHYRMKARNKEGEPQRISSTHPT